MLKQTGDVAYIIATPEEVSVALNGIFDLQNVKQQFGQYQVDLSSDKQMQKNIRDQGLQEIVQSGVKKMEIQLQPGENGGTRMNFRYEYSDAMDIFGMSTLILLDLFMTGLLFALFLSASTVVGTFMLLMIIPILYTLLCVWFAVFRCGAKNKKKRIRKVFMERVIEFIGIIREHEMKKRS